MAEHTRTLHYQRETQTSGVRLYTTNGDVTSPTVITAGNVVNEGTLSTTAADDITPALRLMDGNTTVYAQLEEITASNANETGLKVSANGKNYVVLDYISSAAIGIALVSSGGGSGTWARIDAFGDAVQ